MRCCGEPVHKDDQYTNRSQPVAAGVVQQQPAPQPGAQIYEKPALLSSPTGPSPPPPSFQANHPLLQGRPGSQWGHVSPSPPPLNLHHQNIAPQPSMGTLVPPRSSPPFDLSGGTNFPVAMPTGTPLYQPSPVHALHRNTSTSPSVATSTAYTVTSGTGNALGGVSEEGRMSISIDFGLLFSFSFFFLTSGPYAH